jgi:hypothetical protein
MLRPFLLTAVVLILGVVAPCAHADDTPTDHDEVKVNLGGDREVMLERVIEGTDLWESLCVGTCETPIPRDGLYRIAGHGVRPSLPLSLSVAHDGAVHLQPHLAYTAGYVGGILLSVVGPLVIMGGSIAIASNSGNQPIEEGCFGCGGTPVSQVPNNSAVIGGGIAIGMGAALTIAGIVAIALSHHTNVNQMAFTVSPRNLTLTF